jgi:phosphoglycolate phosphatase
MNYIFDFDGTICDSFDTTLQIANKYLIKFKQKPIDAKFYREKGVEEIIKDYKISKVQLIIYVYKSRHELAKYHFKTFNGIPQVLSQLSENNTLGIVSSNSKANIEKFLKENKIEKYFDFIYSSPTIFEKSKKIEIALKKYKLSKLETFYIGDEPRDIEAAKKTHLKSIAVSWGFADYKLLKKYKPDYLLRKPEEILRLASLAQNDTKGKNN